jgi:murein DD-endopeptidase MepM/ murein hydrolase activator NlpD
MHLVSMKKRTFTTLSIPILCGILSLGASTARANVLSDIGHSISSLWGQKSRKIQAAHVARSKANAQGQQVEFLHDRLERTQQLLQTSNINYRNYFEQMRRTEARLNETRQRSKIVEARYKAHRRQFARRLAVMQRHGETNYLQVALGSTSFADLTRRTAFFQAITQRDSELQGEIKADKAELLRNQNILMAQWNERNGLLQAANRERMRIAQGEIEQRNMWQQLNNSRLALINYAAAQEQSSNEIGSMIGSLESRKSQIIANYEAQAARERAALRAQARYQSRTRYSRYNGNRTSSQRYSRRNYRSRGARYYRPGGQPMYAPQLAPRLNMGSQFAPRVELAPMPIESLGSLGGSSGWTLPARGRLSSRFGMRFHPVLRRVKMHTGDDIAATQGSPIRAAKGGRVLWAGWKKAYGNTIIVDVGGGMTTLYGHASKVGVRPGQPVAAGEYIGNVGSTGFSTGPHLHFEVRKNGRPINPTGYLTGHRH